MFDGSEQFHQLIASSTASLPISLPFLLHGNPSFDPYAPPLHNHHHHHQSSSPKKYPSISSNLALESERSTDPWSNDELLALLKLRSSMEIWFPDFTWEHVSRKLGEVGFKRSGVECKDKFEEESRHFNYSDLDDLYHAQEDDREMTKKPHPTQCKRKRRDKLEKFKGFCEAVVSKMMSKQEELHKKLIDDIVRRDEDKIAREEAWRKQEMDRIRSQIEIRSKEQKSTAERQATIIEFLKHLTTSDQLGEASNSKSNSNSNSSSSFCKSTPPQTDVATPIQQNPPPSRWPRDEVLELINLRCKTGGAEGKEGAKGPLWERISQGMMEMGYKRSAKRCKEKWENINKYFRKTKDGSKKRSVNSRTCPYFHQLSSLYSDGTIVAPNAADTPSEINQ